jgi:hypothetical protein
MRWALGCMEYGVFRMEIRNSYLGGLQWQLSVLAIMTRREMERMRCE